MTRSSVTVGIVAAARPSRRRNGQTSWCEEDVPKRERPARAATSSPNPVRSMARRPPDEGRKERRNCREGKDEDARLERREPQDPLEVDRKQEEGPDQAEEEEHGHRERAEQKTNVHAEPAAPTDSCPHPETHGNQQGKPHCEGEQHPPGRPPTRARIDESPDDSSESQRDHRVPTGVERRTTARRGRASKRHQYDTDGQDADGDVRPEDGPPRRGSEQDAADQRSDGGAGRGSCDPEAKGQSETVAGHGFADDGDARRKHERCLGGRRSRDEGGTSPMSSRQSSGSPSPLPRHGCRTRCGDRKSARESAGEARRALVPQHSLASTRERRGWQLRVPFPSDPDRGLRSTPPLRLARRRSSP